MTSGIGILADLGVVLLFDSQSTCSQDSTRKNSAPTKRLDAKKIYAISDREGLRAAAGYSGSCDVGNSVLPSLKDLYSQALSRSDLMKGTSSIVRNANLEAGSLTGTLFDQNVQTGFLVGVYHEKPELWTVFPMGFASPVNTTAIGSGSDIIFSDLKQRYDRLERPTVIDAVVGGYELLKRSMADLVVGGPLQVSVVTKDKIYDYSPQLMGIEKGKDMESLKFLEAETAKLYPQTNPNM